jgi:hypothetical protein
MRPIPHRDHLKFVENEGWTPKGTARGTGKQGDHKRYTLTLATGEVLYTRVSHGGGQIDDPKVVKQILRDQLHVSEEDFWRCVNDGTKPPRPQLEQDRGEGEELDAALVRNLVRRVGLSVEEVGRLTKEEAVQAWQDYLTHGGQ